eukprot:403361660
MQSLKQEDFKEIEIGFSKMRLRQDIQDSQAANLPQKSFEDYVKDLQCVNEQIKSDKFDPIITQSVLKDSMSYIQTLDDHIRYKLKYLQSKDSSNYEILCTVIIQDLAENCYTESLEFPIGIMLLKSLTLVLIQNIQLGQGKSDDDEILGDQQTLEVSQKIDLSHKLIFSDLLSHLLIQAQQIISIKQSSQNQLCYCNEKIKISFIEEDNDELIQCTYCKTIFHLDCLNRRALTQKAFQCLDCQASLKEFSTFRLLDLHNELKDFYTHQRQSYHDFTDAYAYVILRQQIIDDREKVQGKKLRQELETEYTRVQEQKFDKSQLQDRSWISRGQQLSIHYIRNVLKYLSIELELRDVIYFKHATMRAKAMRAIKNIIKINQENFVDPQIQKIISLRLQDISSGTREGTLDLISQFLQKRYLAQKQEKSADDNSSFLLRKFLEIYGIEIINRAKDQNSNVRKKALGILSLILQNFQPSTKKNNRDNFDFHRIMSTLIQSWEESNQDIKQVVVKSLKKILKSQLLQTQQNYGQSIYMILFEIIEQIAQDFGFKADQQKNEIRVKNIENLLIKIFGQVLVEEDKTSNKSKDQSIMNLYGEQIADYGIGRIIQAQTQDQTIQLHTLLLRTLTKLSPVSFRKKIKILSNFLAFGNDQASQNQGSQSDKIKKSVIQILAIIIQFLNQHKDSDFDDYLTPKTLSEILNLILNVIKNQKIKLLYPAIELAIELSNYQMEYQEVTKLFVQSFVYVQSIQKMSLQKKFILKQPQVLTLSKSIMIITKISHLSKLKNLDNLLKVNTIKEIQVMLTKLIQVKGIDESIIDMQFLFQILIICRSLEGLSLIWIQHQQVLIENQECLKIFEFIHHEFQIKKLNFDTMTRVIDTLLNFLNIYEVKMKANQQNDMSQFILLLQPHLMGFLKYYDLKNMTFGISYKEVLMRVSLVQLISKLFDLNLLHMIDACKLFMIMVCDCHHEIKNIGNLGLVKVSQRKYEVIVSCIQPNSFVLNPYEIQIQFLQQKSSDITTHNIYSDFTRLKISEDSDSCFYDQMLLLLNEKQLDILPKIFENVLIYSDEFDLEIADQSPTHYNLNFIRFCGEILLCIIKNAPKSHEQFKTTIEDYLLKNEVTVYEKLKNQQKVSIKYLQKCFIIFILRAGLRFIAKLINLQKNSNRYSQNQEEHDYNIFQKQSLTMESNEVKQMQRDKAQKYFNEIIEEFQDWSYQNLNDLSQKQYLKVQHEFKDHLKLLMKEKQLQYKLKIEKRLFGRIKQMDEVGYRQKGVKIHNQNKNDSDDDMIDIGRGAVKGNRQAKSMQIHKSINQPQNQKKRKFEQISSSTHINQEQVDMNQNIQEKQLQQENAKRRQTVAINKKVRSQRVRNKNHKRSDEERYSSSNSSCYNSSSDSEY